MLLLTLPAVKEEAGIVYLEVLSVFNALDTNGSLYIRKYNKYLPARTLDPTDGASGAPKPGRAGVK